MSGTRGNYNMLWGTFNILVSEVILGSFGELVSKWHVTRKRLAVDENEKSANRSCRASLAIFVLYFLSVYVFLCVTWLNTVCNVAESSV